MSSLRRSAVLIWGVVALTVMASPALAQMVYGTPSGWRERSEAAFGFSVELPVEIRRLEDNQDGDPGVSLDFRDQTAQVMIQASDFGRGGGAPDVTADRLLDEISEGFAGEHQMVLVAKQAAIVDGAPARDATYRSDALKILMKVRFIWTQGRLYTLTVVANAEGPLPPSYERVLKSFKPFAPRPPGPGSR